MLRDDQTVIQAALRIDEQYAIMRRLGFKLVLQSISVLDVIHIVIEIQNT